MQSKIQSNQSQTRAVDLYTCIQCCDSFSILSVVSVPVAGWSRNSEACGSCQLGVVGGRQVVSRGQVAGGAVARVLLSVSVLVNARASAFNREFHFSMRSKWLLSF